MHEEEQAVDASKCTSAREVASKIGTTVIVSLVGRATGCDTLIPKPLLTVGCSIGCGPNRRVSAILTI